MVSATHDIYSCNFWYSLTHMIFLLPLILAMDVLQHAVGLVTVGYLGMELFLGYSAAAVGQSLHATCAVLREKRRELLILLLLALGVGGVSIMNYFVPLENTIIHVLLRVPVLVVAVYGFITFSHIRHAIPERTHAVAALKVACLILIPLLLADLFVTTSIASYNGSWTDLVLAGIKVVEIASLYFFALVYTIRMDAVEQLILHDQRMHTQKYTKQLCGPGAVLGALFAVLVSGSAFFMPAPVAAVDFEVQITEQSIEALSGEEAYFQVQTTHPEGASVRFIYELRDGNTSIVQKEVTHTINVDRTFRDAIIIPSTTKHGVYDFAVAALADDGGRTEAVTMLTVRKDSEQVTTYLFILLGGVALMGILIGTHLQTRRPRLLG